MYTSPTAGAEGNVNVFVGAPQMEAKDLVKAYLDESVEFKANYCDH